MASAIMKFLIWALLSMPLVLARPEYSPVAQESPEEQGSYMPSWDQAILVTKFLLDAVVQQPAQTQEPTVVIDTRMAMDLSTVQPIEGADVDDDVLNGSVSLETLRQPASQQKLQQQIVKQPVSRPTVGAAPATFVQESSLITMLTRWLFGAQQQQQKQKSQVLATNHAQASSVGNVFANAVKDPVVLSAAQRIIGDLASVYLRSGSPTPTRSSTRPSKKRPSVASWTTTESTTARNSGTTEPADAGSLTANEVKSSSWTSWFG